MQKTANRILSMLLALVMVFTLLPATVLADGEADVLEGWSITLGDNIGVKFYLNSADYTVTTTVNGAEVTPLISEKVVTVNVAAAQMTDTIGLTVKNGEETVHTGEYSVRQYAETLLTGEYDDEVKTMVKEMLNYGAAAQTYFDYAGNGQANAGYELETAATVPTEVPEITAEDNLDGISLYGMSLIFQNKTAVRFYFTVSGNIADYTFKVGETAYAPVEKDGKYYVEIGDINPQDLDENIIVSVNDGAMTVTYSPMNYIVRKYNNEESSAQLKALVQAMYGYHKEAESYQAYLASEAIRPKEGNVAALNIHYIRDSAPMSFITKAAYPAGTTITFKAYQPYIADTNNNWWGVGTTADAASGDIYACAAAGNNMYSADNDNRWAQYSYTIPADSADSYIYIAGAKNVAWINDPLLIDDVVITTPDGESVTDGFEYGLNAGLFNVNAVNSSDADAVTVLNLSPVTDRTGNVAALTVNKLNEGSPMSFITKAAYAGGSTVSFEAYVPAGATWWAVCWTTDPADVDLYKWTAGLGQDMTAASVKDAWAQYYVTLPDDGNNYYIYFVGAKGEWKDAEGNDLQLLIDNVSIAKGTTVATDDFEGTSLFDMNDGAALLNLTPVSVTAQEALADLKADYGDTMVDGAELASTWTVSGFEFTVNWTVDAGASVASIEDGKLVLTPQGTTVNYLLKATVSYGDDTASYSWIGSVKPQANTVAAITVDHLNEGNPMSFITKAAYAGGSTVSFEAYVPAGASWWAVSWTTDPANVDLYKWTEGLGQAMSSQNDQWAQYSVTLPDDGNNYYIYFVGAKGEWGGKALLVDNVTIAKGGTSVTDDFEGTSLFNMGNGTALQTIEPQEVTPQAGSYAAIYMDKLTEETASFITKQAYAGGSTVTLEAYVPSGTSWWAVSWTTDPANVGLYKWTEGFGQAMTSQNDQWAQYSVTLPNDGNSYYVYIVGAKGEWGGKALLVDNVTIGTVTEDFEEGLDNSIFTYIPRSSDEEVLVELCTDNYALQVQVANLTTGIDLITKKAFPAGSTVTFDAKVPEGSDWWALNWTTDPGLVNNEDARYAHVTSGTSINSFVGSWSNYTVTLPASGGPYHLFFAGPNEWGTNTLLLDNFKVVDAEGNVIVNENFNHAVADSVFAGKAEAVSMYEVLSYEKTEDAEIAFTAYAAPTVNRNVTTADAGAIGAAYRKMADAGFNKAIALFEGLSGTVTATDAAGVKTQIAQRSAVVEAVAQIVMQKAAQSGITYYAKDWSLYNMGGKNTDEYGVNASLGLTQSDFNDIISTMFDSDNPYSGNSGYAGHFGYDEPFYADLEKVGWAAKAYNEAGASGELFVNLLPTYVDKNSPQLGAENLWGELFGNYTYENYLNEYLSRTNGYLDYICWDYYPFLNASNAAGNDITDQQSTRLQKYLAGYELMANAAKTNNRDLRIIIQSSGDSTGVKDLSGKSELSFQIYSGLAFGVNEFIYYMYSGSSTSGYDYLFHYDNQTYNDSVYGWAQAVNNDVHTFEEVYDEYTWSNVMKVDADNSSVMMNNLTNAVTSSDKLKVEGEGDYLVGLFTAKDASSTRQNAFMLVNAEYDPNAAAGDVVLTIPGASALSICRNGQQTVIKLNDTQCILRDVQPGEGIFLVPLY